MTGGIVQQVVNFVAGIGLPGALILYLRDRRKNKAVARVAEGTVSSQIRSRDTAALDAHVAYVEKAFETERKSMKRQIDSMKDEVTDLRKQVIERDRLIDSLRQQVAGLTEQMQSLQDQLNKIPPSGK